MIKFEQTWKIDAIKVDEKKMIKWQIFDKRYDLQCISDSVTIDGFQFVFYAERDIKKYKGLKIYTWVILPNAKDPQNTKTDIPETTNPSNPSSSQHINTLKHQIPKNQAQKTPIPNIEKHVTPKPTSESYQSHSSMR